MSDQIRKIVERFSAELQKAVHAEVVAQVYAALDAQGIVPRTPKQASKHQAKTIAKRAPKVPASNKPAPAPKEPRPSSAPRRSAAPLVENTASTASAPASPTPLEPSVTPPRKTRGPRAGTKKSSPTLVEALVVEAPESPAPERKRGYVVRRKDQQEAR